MSTRVGRPTKYAPEIGAEICFRLAEGVSLSKICEGDEFPARRTVNRWLFDALPEDDPRLEFRYHYARARLAQAEHWADEIIDIADDDLRDYGTDEHGKPVQNPEHIQRARLRIDTRKWILSKMLPRFADKVVHEGGDKPITHKVVDERETLRRMALILTDADEATTVAFSATRL